MKLITCLWNIMITDMASRKGNTILITYFFMIFENNDMLAKFKAKQFKNILN